MNWDDYAPYFSESEFACHCGCGRAEMSPDFLRKLHLLRITINAPMAVSSGFRCPKYNAKVSSTGANGPHTTGHAADIRCFGGTALQIISGALRVHMTGIGVSQKNAPQSRFIHLDDLPNAPGQPRPWVWSY